MVEREEIPDDRCGFELQPEDIDVEEDEVDLEEWHQGTKAVCCYRSVWQGGRCIWHTDIEDKSVEDLVATRAEGPERLDGAILRKAEMENAISLTRCGLLGADLREATLTDADLRGATLTDADLRGATLTNAVLGGADLTDAYLRGATLTNAYLRDADLTDADLRGATLTNAALGGADLTGADLRKARFTDPDDSQARPANLEDAVLEGADLRETDFRRAQLFQTVLTDARINSRTEFDSNTIAGVNAATVYEQQSDIYDWSREETLEQAAAWVHRRLESLHEENAMSEEARQFHIYKQEAERTHHWRQAREKLGDPPSWEVLYHGSRWSVLTLIWALTNHGESLRRLLGWSAATIIVSAILYPLLGGFESDANGQVYQYSLAAWWGVDSCAEALDVIASGVPTFLQSLYFSVITFTTIGYGDLYPTGAGAKFLVGVESLFGAVLVALFIFVLGRRVAR